MADYLNWMRTGRASHRSKRRTSRGSVEGTWARCAALARRPGVKALLRTGDERTRRFVEAFEAIRQASAGGAMAYGMFTAKKA